jgi:Uma2 family endonuclease
MSAPLPRHKLNLEDYHRMIEAGIFTPNQRIELLEGKLFDMAPIGPAHSGTTNYLTRLFFQAVGDKAIVSVQNPVMLGDNSEPQPDLMILRSREDFYRSSHPVAEEVLLLVEIADTSASSDRSYKIPLYARHGIPEVWLLDVKRQQLEIHTQPEQGQYRQVHLAQTDEAIRLSQLPEIEINVRQIW